MTSYNLFPASSCRSGATLLGLLARMRASSGRAIMAVVYATWWVRVVACVRVCVCVWLCI